MSFFLKRRPPPSSTLFPYTTLFRSERDAHEALTIASEHGAYFRTPVALDRLGLLAVSDNPRTAARLLGSAAGIRQRSGEIHFLDVEQCDAARSEEHTSELQSRRDLVCRLLLEKKKKKKKQ